jgi:hypothetical protein
LNPKSGIQYDVGARVMATPTSQSEPVLVNRPINNCDSIWIRVLPPAFVAAAWLAWDLKLIRPEAADLIDWKILGLALPVFWLAIMGPTELAKHARWKPILAAAGLLVAGLLLPLALPAGQTGSALTSYRSKIIYAAIHATIAGSLGILALVALGSQKKNQ